MTSYRTRRILPVAIPFLALAGCCTIDPSSDYCDTAKLIADHTAAPETFTPAMDEESLRAAVEGLLEGGVTVDEAVRIALLNNAKLQSLFFDVGVSRAELVQAALPPNPSFFISSRFPEGGGRANLTTAFGQELVDILLIPLRKAIAASRLEQEKLRVAQEAISLVTDVKREWYEALGLRRAQAVTEQSVKLAEHSVEVVQRRMEAGESDQIEVNMVRNDLLSVKHELMTVRRNRRMAEGELALLMGISRWNIEWTLQGDFISPRSPPDDEELLEWALRERLDVRTAKLRLESAEEELALARRGIIKSFSVGAEFERAEAPPNLFGPVFELTLPIWDQNQANIAKAAYRLARSREEYESVLDRAAEEVERAAIAVRENGLIVRFHETEALPHVKENVEMATRAFESGRHNVLLLSQAQRSLIEEQRDYIQALRDYAMSVSDLELAVGGRLMKAAMAPKDEGELP